MAVKDVDHATTGRFTRGPETTVTVKVEDNIVARTRPSRNDRWEAEYHNIEVDKANELELTVYDKPGEHPLPIGLLWVRISDIVEEMRRKKIEAETNNSGWVSADTMQRGGPPSQFPMSPQPGQQQQFGGGGPGSQAGGQQGVPGALPPVPAGPIDCWFNLEPSGRIHLSISFEKTNKDRRPVDLGLGRKGAIRQRKEDVHEMYGHKFIEQQFYNIMRCALCGEFLKYSAGMQCEDCKYTCHTKCYPSVVTKCISKSNAETDPDEEKINHRIPHRFQPFSNMTANWCCHCGYMLPFGKKNSRKCSGMFSVEFMAALATTRKRLSANVSNRVRSHLPRSLRPSGTRLLWHVYGHGQPDSGGHKNAEAEGAGEGVNGREDAPTVRPAEAHPDPVLRPGLARGNRGREGHLLRAASSAAYAVRSHVDLVGLYRGSNCGLRRHVRVKRQHEAVSAGL